MSSNYHLLERRGVWNYHRRVPAHLQSKFGTKVQTSLGTKDVKVARSHRSALDLIWNARFDEASAESSLVGIEHPKAFPISAHVIELLKQFIEGRVEAQAHQLISDPYDNPEQLKDVRTEKEISLNALRWRDDPDGDKWIEQTQKAIFGNAAPAGPEQRELVRRALMEVLRRQIAILDDRYDGKPFDFIFSEIPSKGPTLAEAVAAFIAQVKEEAYANSQSAKSVQKRVTSAELVCEVLGADRQVAKVDYEACLKFRSTLAVLPTNRSKRFKGLGIEELVSKAKAGGVRLLGPLTQAAYLATLRDILDLAVKKGQLSTNPAAGLKPLTKDPVALKDKRRPLSAEQIAALLHSDFYQRASALVQPFQIDPNGWRFWLPPIMVLMGMRPNEICQLQVDDIKREQGIDYVSVTDGGDEDGPGQKKQLKTMHSKRRVPIHAELVRMGFLDYVDQRRMSKATRLFPTLKPNKYGNLAWYPVKRFGEVLLPEAVKLEQRQTLYSLRHSFRDALRAVEAPPDVLQALGGWSQHQLVSDHYGDSSKPAYTNKYLQMVTYTDVSFSHLHVAAKVDASNAAVAKAGGFLADHLPQEI
jgi:integrase